MTRPIRVLVIDDSPRFLEAARDFILLHDELELVGSASAPGEALEQFERLSPDLALLDINLENSSGLEMIPAFRKRAPEVKIIALSMMDENPYRQISLRAGADAFVQKAEMFKTLPPTIREIFKRN